MAIKINNTTVINDSRGLENITNLKTINSVSILGTGDISVQPLDADLTAIAGLAGTSGILKKTAADTWSLDTSAYLTGNQSITVSGDATGSGTTSISLTLANSGVSAGTYKSVTVDAKGRVTSGTNPTTLSGYGITDAVAIAGSTMTGALTLSADPTNALHAATKQYVDNIAAGLDTKQSVVAATTANITLSGTQTIDGVAVVANDRVLVKNQTTTAQNGIYVVAAGAWTRSTDTNLWSEFPGAFVFVEKGTTNADTGWVCTVDQGGTLDTTAITWTQFAGAGSITAGTGVSVSGNQVSLATLADGGTGTFLKLTRDTYGRVSGTAAVAASDVTGLSGFLSSTAGASLAASGSAGTGTTVARADHVHPFPTAANVGAQPSNNTLTSVAGLSTATTGLVKLTNGVASLDSSAYLTSNQSITVSGDASGSGTTAITLTLANSGATAGTYKSVTVDAKGRVTSGTNPTTLAGYGITDAQALDADLTAIAGLVGTSGLLKKTAADTWALDTNTYLTGNQTVTISGDATGSGTTAISLTLANSGVTAGTYKSVTVDAKGRVTSGTNPTTLAGYGITDALVLGSTSGEAPGVASAGSATTAARSDHVHPLQTAVTGNAGTATKLATVRSITATGDASWTVNFDGSANTAAALTLANSGVTAGTYKSVTVDAKGRVTGGTNPTTLAGYGITDAVENSKLGVANGVATLDASGLVPASQLPSYVDDVVEYTSLAALPATGETGKIYVTQDTNKIYRWSGSAYIEISPVVGNSDSATKLATVRSITATGDASWTVNFDGSANVTAALTLANSGATAGTYKSVTVDAKGRVTGGTNPTTLAGYGITDATASSHVGATGTAHGVATTTVAGFMSAADKTKLDGVASGANNYVHPTTDGSLHVPATGTTSANKVLVAGATAGSFSWETLDLSYLPDAASKKSVRAATTANITLSAPQTIDGVSLVAGDRVLVKDQTTGSQNGIYVVQAAAWTRSTDADASSKIAGAMVNVDSGTVNGGIRFDTDFKTTDTLGTTTMTWDRMVDTGMASGVVGSAPGTAAIGTSLSYARADHVHPLQTSVSGNAGTATTLQTARTLTIGSTAKSFDGSAGVSWTRSEIGVPMMTTSTNVGTENTESVIGYVTNSLFGVTDGALYSHVYSELWKHQIQGDYRTGQIAVRGKNNGVWQSWRTVLDSSNYNTYSPTLTGTGASGTWGISITGSSASTTGNAGTATKLATVRSITATGDASWTVDFDGSANTTAALTLANSGVAAGTYKSVTVDAKGRVTGGTNPTTLAGYGITDAQPLDAELTAVAGLVGNGLIVKTGAGAATTRTLTVTGTGLSITNADGIAGNPTITSNATSVNTASTIVSRDASGNFTAGTITAALSGNASTASTLATSRNITATGDASWTVSFNGSADASAALTLANSGVTAGTYTKVTVDAKGRVTSGANLASTDVTTALGFTPVNKAGDQLTGFLRTSIATGLTAAGTTQATGLVLSSSVNVVATTAAGTGVVLPAAQPGMTVVVMNLGANSLAVYPASGAAIDALGANAAFSLATPGRVMFIAISATQWYTLNASYA